MRRQAQTPEQAAERAANTKRVLGIDQSFDPGEGNTVMQGAEKAARQAATTTMPVVNNGQVYMGDVTADQDEWKNRRNAFDSAASGTPENEVAAANLVAKNQKMQGSIRSQHDVVSENGGNGSAAAAHAASVGMSEEKFREANARQRQANFGYNNSRRVADGLIEGARAMSEGYVPPEERFDNAYNAAVDKAVKVEIEKALKGAGLTATDELRNSEEARQLAEATRQAFMAGENGDTLRKQRDNEIMRLRGRDSYQESDIQNAQNRFWQNVAARQGPHSVHDNSWRGVTPVSIDQERAARLAAQSATERAEAAEAANAARDRYNSMVDARLGREQELLKQQNELSNNVAVEEARGKNQLEVARQQGVNQINLAEKNGKITAKQASLERKALADEAQKQREHEQWAAQFEAEQHPSLMRLFSTKDDEGNTIFDEANFKSMADTYFGGNWELAKQFFEDFDGRMRGVPMPSGTPTSTSVTSRFNGDGTSPSTSKQPAQTSTRKQALNKIKRRN